MNNVFYVDLGNTALKIFHEFNNKKELIVKTLIDKKWTEHEICDIILSYIKFNKSSNQKPIIWLINVNFQYKNIEKVLKKYVNIEIPQYLDNIKYVDNYDELGVDLIASIMSLNHFKIQSRTTIFQLGSYCVELDVEPYSDVWKINKIFINSGLYKNLENCKELLSISIDDYSNIRKIYESEYKLNTNFSVIKGTINSYKNSILHSIKLAKKRGKVLVSGGDTWILENDESFKKIEDLNIYGLMYLNNKKHKKVM